MLKKSALENERAVLQNIIYTGGSCAWLFVMCVVTLQIQSAI